ncbi:hypothetical protein D3C76_1881500 [compost metagenome]
MVKGEQLVDSCRRLELVCAEPQASDEALRQAVNDVEVAIMELERALGELSLGLD